MLLTVCLLILVSGNAAANSADEDGRWRGAFSFTPGVGLRHLGLDVVETTSGLGLQGNLSNDVWDSAFAAMSIESPEYQFGKSNFGFTIYAYAATVTLDHQWVSDGGTSPSGTSSGSREDVGTSVTGYYSYFVPALHYRWPHAGGSESKFALGVGSWMAKFSGDIILTPDDMPAPGMTKTNIDVRVRKLAYLLLMQHKFANGWQAYMSLGGPTWEQEGFEYKLEEVSLVIGYTFSL
ncbi:MAG: hypothetical protein A2072_07435 [Nitrospirae bacterium GWC1_57_7]|nr:MAG: hypothetical protein A2072_07435 [Nitrospirae bacterium GWC1_57_7]